MARGPRAFALSLVCGMALGACALVGAGGDPEPADATLQFTRTEDGTVVAIGRTDVDRFVVVVLSPVAEPGLEARLEPFLLARGIGRADQFVFAAGPAVALSCDVGRFEVSVTPAGSGPSGSIVELRHGASRAFLLPCGAGAALLDAGDADDADVIGVVAPEERGALRQEPALRETWIVVDATAGDARCLALADRPLFLSNGSGWKPVLAREGHAP